jgi:hypothetical protein
VQGPVGDPVTGRLHHVQLDPHRRVGGLHGIGHHLALRPREQAAAGAKSEEMVTGGLDHGGLN